MRFGILLAFSSKHLAVESLSKVYLDLFLGAMIMEQLMESLLTPEGDDRFLHHLALCMVLVVPKENVQDVLKAQLLEVLHNMSH